MGYNNSLYFIVHTHIYTVAFNVIKFNSQQIISDKENEKQNTNSTKKKKKDPST